MNRSLLSSALLLVLLPLGCGPSAPTAPAKTQVSSHQKVAELFEKINIGDDRAQVQKLLGAPFMIQKTQQGETAMYMAGMEGMNEAMQAQMRVAQTGAAASGILGAATGLLGLAGPGGAIAGGIANQALSAGMGLAGGGAAMAMPDPADMEMLMVTYQGGKVASLQRMNMGAMGAGMNPDTEVE